MNLKPSPITKTSSRLSLPLMMTVMYYIVRCITKQTPHLSNEAPPASLNIESNFSSSNMPNEQYKKEPLRHIERVIAKHMQGVSAGVYHEYLQFIATMLVIHIGIKVLMETAKYLIKLYQHSRAEKCIQGEINASIVCPGHHEPKGCKLKKTMKYVSFLMVIYSLIYLLSFVIYICTPLVCQSAYNTIDKHDDYSLELTDSDMHQGADLLQSYPDSAWKYPSYSDAVYIKAPYPSLKQKNP